jgi:hypothetical protein
MMRAQALPRRTFLKGLGTTLALPLLEAMAPPVRLAAAVTPDRLPQRLAFIFVPNGVNMADWKPTDEGSDFRFPYILEPLESVREDVLVLSGLAHDKARPNGDGAGDHARASATFLTGCQARKTAGADIKVGISVDQVAAQKIGHLTHLPSLELGCDRGQQVGNCDSGYSCAYSFNISWKTESTPLPAEVNPRLLFERLFGNGNSREMAENRGRRERYNQSILDFVLEDARQLHGQLGSADQRKLDEYLSAVRELETRVGQAVPPSSLPTDFPKPKGIPDNYEEHIRLMFDLLALAFQTDSTRVASFIMAHDGSNRPYPFIDVSEGHHDLSHHGDSEEKKEKIGRINRFHLTQFANFLQKLKATPEGQGRLLDNCMIVYGSGISDGNSHAHNDLPVLLAGHGGGSLNPGRHVQYPRDTPMANLFISLLERAGVQTERVGDSSGRLPFLS